jgi:ATP-dependent Clp protease ATP-binding subunit ClpA
VFERFTERARHVVVLAQDEARALKHDYIGTEHLLLGILREEHGAGGRVLEALGVRAVEARSQVVRIVGEGDEVRTGQIPSTATRRAHSNSPCGKHCRSDTTPSAPSTSCSGSSGRARVSPRKFCRGSVSMRIASAMR